MKSKRTLSTVSLSLCLALLLTPSLNAQQQIERPANPGVNDDLIAKHTLPKTHLFANGTLEPDNVFDVSAEVSGPLRSFGADVDGKTVDYRSKVKKGQVLAQIDPSLYVTELRNFTAKRKFAEANAAVKKAELSRLKIIGNQARKSTERAADADSDKLKNADELARANVAVCEAELNQAEAAVAEAQTDVDRAQANIDFCTIHSPCDGLVIDRRMSPGQNVVSGLSAPSLFLIAQSLKHMQVWVDASEWQAVRTKPGQPVTFTVNAYPGETFNGTVKLVRLNATMAQNEVHYTVEVDTDNSNERLLPYLTATVHFQFDKE